MWENRSGHRRSPWGRNRSCTTRISNMSTGSEMIADCRSIRPLPSGRGLGEGETRECGVKKVSILYITDNGLELAGRLKSLFPDAGIVRYHAGLVPGLWTECDALVFIMASGIVVRTIAPLLKDKKSDPAVVVLDEQGKFAVSLVSGHLGGANGLARELAGFLKGEAVITTASDVNNLPSIDLWARDNNLIIENWDVLPQVGARYVNNGGLRVYCDIPLELPPEFLRIAEMRHNGRRMLDRSLPGQGAGLSSAGQPHRGHRMQQRHVSGRDRGLGATSAGGP